MYAAAALACVLAFGFVGACDPDKRTFRIRSASMEPTLHCERPAELCGGEVSDTIVAEEVEGALDRGDIVVYELTPRAIELCGAESGKFVSRIVALPGERIAVRRGLVRVNGKVLEEPYPSESSSSSELAGIVRGGAPCAALHGVSAGRPSKLRRVPATVIVGAQWGDEGKGKVVDLLAEHSDVVCRYQGGPNAGHTIVREGETFKLHHIPSGILYEGKTCVVGAGCVVDPGLLVRELDELEARGISTDGLRVSGNAHLIMPWHLAIDSASERRLGKLQIGTTRRGIGPAYADKAARIGIRVQDVLDPKILRQKFETALAEKNVVLERVYGAEPLAVEALAERMEGFAARLRPYVADTSLLVDEALKRRCRVLLEGAQGTLLDLDHGTYPFVTSSNPTAGAAATGTGIGPTRIDQVVGVAKAYVTRVGEGPFPTEIEGPDHERVRELGREYGTTTGRARRCGWLDLVALRFAVRVNGLTSLALTKLDVLSAFDRLPVCTRYRLPGGEETADFPGHQSDFHHARPVWETLSGWRRPLDGVADRASLPPAARDYVEFVEREAGVEISMIGTGAERERVLAPEELAAVAGR